MQAFRSIGSALRSVSSALENAGSGLSSVPFLGMFAATSFYRAAWYVDNAADGFFDLSSWADGVARAVDRLPDTLDRFKNQVTANIDRALDRVTGQIDRLKSTIDANVNRVISAAVNGVNRAVDNLKSSVTSTLSDFRSKVSGIQRRIDNVGSGLASDVWKWIAANALAAYLEKWKTGLQTLVLSWVKASMGAMIKEAFTVVNSQWAAFQNYFVWLCEQLIKLVRTEAKRLAPVVWAAVEAVVGELSQWEEK